MNISQLHAEDIGEVTDLWGSQLDYEPDPRAVIDWYSIQSPGFISRNDEGSLTGFAISRVISKGDILELYNLLVSTDERNRGIGTLLVKQVEMAAIEEGYGLIVVTNSMRYQGPGKKSAVKFYEGLNYRIIQTVDQTTLLCKTLS